MKDLNLKTYLLFLFLWPSGSLFAGVEPAISAPLDGVYFIQSSLNPLYISNATFTNDLFDFSINSTPYSFPADQHIRKIDNMLELYLNPDHPNYIAFPYTLEVEVNILKYDYGAVTPSSNKTTLKINYDPKERSKWVEKANFHFINCGRVEYTVTNVTLTPGLTDQQKKAVADAVGLRSDIIIERYFDFDINTRLFGPDIWNLYDLNSNELTINWQILPGAEYYDLEWAYVDNYKDKSSFLPPSQLELDKHYNLNRNATRVRVAQPEYRFPLVYESGYILYRVRGIGMDYDPSTDQVYTMPGNWSNPNISPGGPEQAPDVGTWNHKFPIPTPFEKDQLNWQIITSYAEEGKNKSILSIMDGSQRTRQTITGLSTEHLAMVAENIFDHQGRPAIQVLPVPTNDPALKFYKHFNQQGNNLPYTRLNFDTTKVNCILSADPMAINSGASRYYSPNNPVKTNENAYIPDAQGYPFVHTEFTPDNTGRIRGQSGVGPNHQLGSKHETLYFYGTPVQEEISRLFGIEVGKASHYKKNVVKDPNGQLSVSFLDLKGKVIATALAGNPPPTLDALESYQPYQMDVDLMVFNKIDSLANELVATKSFTVTTDSYYNFSYTLSNTAYTAALCEGIQLCYDCVYDLEISLIDNYSCNTLKYSKIEKINPLKFVNDSILVDNVCPKNATFFKVDSTGGTQPFKVWLPVGSYTITKTLKVNEAATQAYVQDYLVEFEKECTSVYDNILQSYLSQVDSTICDLEDTTKILNRCDVAKQGMLSDLSPGGQYALINWPNYSATDPLSVFNTGNILPQSRGGVKANWRYPFTPYKNENGKAAAITNTSGQPVAPSDQSISLKEFLDNWEPSWAESLLPYHPEYCYLSWCEEDSTSFDFDVELAEVSSYKDAVTMGYLNLSKAEDIMKKDPYFLPGGGGTTSNILPNMPIDLENVIKVYYKDIPNNQNYSMLEIAVLTELLKTQASATLSTAQNWITNHLPGSTVEDSVWYHFRALYLAKKEQFQFKDRTHYAIHECRNDIGNNGGYNECIDTTYFNWHANGFGNGIGISGSGQFHNSSQACSWLSYHLYEDKGKRFPGVYDIPIDFDPYGPPDQAILDFADWAESSISTNCDTCVCANRPMSQFFNWVIDEVPYSPPGMPSVSLPNGTFTPDLQNLLKGCTNKTITQAKAEILLINGSHALRITLIDNANLASGFIFLEIPSGTISIWETADSISCIKSLGIDNGMYVAGGTLFTISNQTYPLKITIRPNCDLWEKCNNRNESCPPTANAIHLSRLINTLISQDSLDKKVVVSNKYIPNSFASFFNPVSNISSDIVWNGQISGNTINATLSGNQARCTFTLEFPAGTNISTTLKDLGPVLSLTPDITQVDPTTGYTYHGILKVMLLNNNPPIDIKIKSGCFPLSYCLKCPPVVGISRRTDSIPVPDKKTRKNRRDPVPPQDPINSDIAGTVPKHDPNKPCYTCDSIGYTLDYDSAVNDTLAIMVHVKPPLDLCDPCAWPDTLPSIPIPNPCIEEQIIAAYANASNAYQQYLDSLTRNFRNGYIRHCLSATETFSKKYTDALHHYTLYYYDQANNLVKTVPPDGVKPLNVSDTKLAIQYMNDPIPGNTKISPQHTMVSNYTFNSLNQLLKQSIPDHSGESAFFYDYLSRIVASQNPEQKINNRYSYSLYDALNRPYETGELINVSTKMTDALAKDEAQLLNWVATNQKREVTRTQYDVPLPGIANQFFNGDDNNYRGRVASVKYLAQDGSPTEHSTYYQYDIHGNVKKLVQDVYQLGPRTVDYNYDLISGNVKKVDYQKGELDQFLHWYEYDSDNRITNVRTSFDGLVWDTDAEYTYYRHGPLARTELGDNKVQGMDFAYTLQGWIKGVNSGVLNERVDIGQDGLYGHPHQKVAKDAFGYLLRYHTGDYQMIGTAPGGLGWEPTYQGSIYPLSNRDLFNGNIQSMITAIGEPANANFPIKPLGYAYQYDQLNRIKAMTAHSGLDQRLNNWNAAQALQDYATQYSYDGNGNLQTLSRNGVSTPMDDFQYYYIKDKNQLEYVSDGVAPGNYPEDIDNQSPGNYQYDAIGNLVADKSENMTITWNVSGKVKSIQKAVTSELIEFSYDPMGKRVLKRVTNTQTKKVESTYYALDATGNVMATYTNVSTPPVQKRSVTWGSAFVYGSSRLGEERIDLSLADLKTLRNEQNNSWYSYRNRGSKYFELSNHLGNVLATVSDRKLLHSDGSNTVAGVYWGPDIWTVSDYYPFGSPMPGRTFSSGGYRYGFNGKENDDEVKGGGNYQDYGMRVYDGRLGRFFSVDPLQ